nr:hypothetical protein [Tanacetum cinerariifolium]
IDAEKPLLKDSDGEDVDVHTYRSLIGSLMYLTSSRPYIMFAVCACARFQVTPKVSHLNAVKRIFRYLKGKPYVGLWYPKDLPFDLVAYSDSDYAEAEYVAATSGCAQVMWIQNQLLDYGNSPLIGVNTPGSDEDRFNLMELMVFLLQRIICVEIGINDARLSKLLLSGIYDAEGFEQIIDFLSGSYIHYALTVSPHIYISCIKQFWNSVSVKRSGDITRHEKSDAAEGFEQIIDILSGSYINHALIVNLHVYISCIKQFWNTAVVKRSGDVTRLQALVDKKRIVITEEVVHEILQLNDAEGIICLPNEAIFAGLARMGYEKPSTKLTFYKAFFSTQWNFFIHIILHSLSAKRTSWNEFSSAMASAVICLSSGQRFNFSNYIFESLVRNVDSSSKFYMVRKGFSGVETPLFESMLVVRDVAEEAEAQVPVQGDDVQEPATEEVVTKVVPPTPRSPITTISCHPIFTSSPTTLVAGLENDKAAQQLEIVKLKARVKKLEKINMVKYSKLRRLKKVGTSQRVASSDDMENVFNQGRIIADMDQDEGIELVADQEKDAKVKGRHVDKQAELYNLDLDHSSKVLSMQEDDTKVQEAIEIVTTAKLMTEVVTAVATQAVAASTPILAAKPKILNIAAASAVLTRRRKGVVIKDLEEELPSNTTPKVKDKGKEILIEAPKPMKKKDQIEMDAEYARKLHEEINKEHEETYKNIDCNAALDHVQSKEPQYIKRYHG